MAEVSNNNSENINTKNINGNYNETIFHNYNNKSNNIENQNPNFNTNNQQQQKQQYFSNESQSLQLAISNKRDSYRTQIRKKNTQQLLVQKRMALAMKHESGGAQNGNIDSNFAKSIREYLPKYLTKDVEKLNKYLSEICKVLRIQIEQIQLNNNSNSNSNNNNNNTNNLANFDQQQYQYYLNSNNNNNSSQTSSCCSSQFSSNSSQHSIDSQTSQHYREKLSKQSNAQIFEDILSNVSKLHRIVNCQEQEPTSYLLEKENLAEILFFLVRQEGQCKLQKEVCLMLGNIVQKDAEIWTLLVQKNDDLCNIFICCFLTEWCFHEAIAGLGNICIDYPQVIGILRAKECDLKINYYIQKFYHELFSTTKQNGNCEKKESKQLNKYLEHLLWLIKVICCSPSGMKSELLEVFIPALDILLQLGAQKLTSKNRNLMLNTLDCLKAIAMNADAYVVSLIMDLKNLPNLFSLVKLQPDNQEILICVQDIISNLTSGSDDHILDLINMGLLDLLNSSLNSNKLILQIQAAFSLRNILTAENKEIHQMFCLNDNFLMTIYLQMNSGSFKVKKQLYYALSNFFIKAPCGPFLCEQFLQKEDFLSAYLNSLDVQDIECLVHCLLGFKALLEKGEGIIPNRNPIQHELDSKGFNNILEGLQQHPSMEVYKATVNIIETFYVYQEQTMEQQ